MPMLDQESISKLVDAALKAGTEVERKRCVQIVQAARRGEIDGDLRCIISRIEGGDALEQGE